jgi:hypothetical protein
VATSAGSLEWRGIRAASMPSFLMKRAVFSEVEEK